MNCVINAIVNRHANTYGLRGHSKAVGVYGITESFLASATSGVTSKHYIHFEDRQIIEAATSFNERLERTRKLEDVLDTEMLDDVVGKCRG